MSKVMRLRYLPCCQRHQWQSCSIPEGHAVWHTSQLLLINTHELCISACTSTQQQLHGASQARKHLTKTAVLCSVPVGIHDEYVYAMPYTRSPGVNCRRGHGLIQPTGHVNSLLACRRLTLDLSEAHAVTTPATSAPGTYNMEHQQLKEFHPKNVAQYDCVHAESNVYV